MAIRPYSLLPGLLLVCAASGPVHAAELGEARVLSHIGQPLSAEVELTLVENGAKPVQASLARPDVYRGANIAMPPVLSGLDIAVIRQGGKQFLRLASLKPVESKHLHVYLELVDGGQRSVRLVTLWLTPDPNPAPPPAPPPVPAPALAAAPLVPAPVLLAPEPAKASKPAPPPVRKPAAPKRRPAPAAAHSEADEHAGVGEHAAPASKPSVSAVKPAEKPLIAAARLADANTPTCTSAPSAAEVNACAVLGAKNDALRQQLGQLESKVKVLQVAAGVKPASEVDVATAATAAKAAKTDAQPGMHGDAHGNEQDNAHGDVPPAAQPDPHSAAQPATQPDLHPAAQPAAHPAAQADGKPKSAPRIHRKPKAPAPPEEPMPWLAIGGAIAGLLALTGLAMFLRRRRAAAARDLKTAREPEVVVLPQDGVAGAPAKPGFMSAVKARLMAVRLGKRPAQTLRVEPEAAAEQPVTPLENV